MTPPRAARGLRVTRMPQPAAAEEYEIAADEIETRLCALPGVVATYRAGGVGAPGISDVDVVAVHEPGVRIAPIWDDLSPRTRYLAMHGPFAIDVATFSVHRAFAHMEPLVHSRGARVEIEPRPVPDLSEPLLAAESLVTAMLTLAKQRATGLLKARPLLCELNNLRHSLALGGLQRDEAPAAWKLSDAVSALRAEWFEEPDAPSNADRMATVAEGAPPALATALSALETRHGHAAAGAPATLELGAQWRAVSLVSGPPGEPLPLPPRGAGTALSARSGRASELRWRLRRHSLAVPAGVLALLAGAAHPPAREFHARRRELVRRYVETHGRSAPGYSAIGLAIPFAGR